MESIAGRIKELIQAEGLSNTEFAKRTGLNPAIISHMTSGRNKPSLQVIISIRTSFTNINLDYLLTGQGSLYNRFTNVNRDGGPKAHPAPPAEEPPAAPSAKEDIPVSGPETAALPPPPTEKQQKENRAPPSPAGNKEVEQIVIFYSDGSFKAYRP